MLSIYPLNCLLSRPKTNVLTNKRLMEYRQVRPGLEKKNEFLKSPHLF